MKIIIALAGLLTVGSSVKADTAHESAEAFIAVAQAAVDQNKIAGNQFIMAIFQGEDNLALRYSDGSGKCFQVPVILARSNKVKNFTVTFPQDKPLAVDCN